MADAIPVSPERITSNENTETDPSASPKQIFLSINIKKDETKQERSVNLAIKDLQNLIEHKAITVIGSGESSRYLDEKYRYMPIRKNFIHIRLFVSRRKKFLKKKTKNMI